MLLWSSARARPDQPNCEPSRWVGAPSVCGMSATVEAITLDASQLTAPSRGRERAVTTESSSGLFHAFRTTCLPSVFAPLIAAAGCRRRSGCSVPRLCPRCRARWSRLCRLCRNRRPARSPTASTPRRRPRRRPSRRTGRRRRSPSADRRCRASGPACRPSGSRTGRHIGHLTVRVKMYPRGVEVPQDRPRRDPLDQVAGLPVHARQVEELPGRAGAGVAAEEQLLRVAAHVGQHLGVAWIDGRDRHTRQLDLRHGAASGSWARPT